MGSSPGTYTKALLTRAWHETWGLFFQKSLPVFIRDLVLLFGGIAFMYAYQDQLVAAGLVPQTSLLWLNKLLPIAFGVAFFVPAYAIYFVAEVLCISPYRLWKDREPPPSGDIVDDETRRLAGVVKALSDRVLIWGFKMPVTYDDPYFEWLADIENSTHPVWIDAEPRTARIDLAQGAKVLPALNRDHEGTREEIEHWRGLIMSSSETLIRLLRGS